MSTRKTVRVRVSFADGTPMGYSDREYIYDAIEAARANLYARYNVKILSYEIDGGVCYIDLSIPLKKGEESYFAVGNHLRGISAHLLKDHPEYREHKVGNRFFDYCEVPATYRNIETSKDPYELYLRLVCEAADLLKKERNQEEVCNRLTAALKDLK